MIVGQDLTDQLVCDQIKQMLKQAREWAKPTDNAATAGPGTSGAAADQPVDEEAAREQRRQQREAEQQVRREAAGHNAELGAACVKHLARVKVDERVVRILSAFDLGGELDKISLRGARYGLPGWVGQEERKNGTTKAVYLNRQGAKAPRQRHASSLPRQDRRGDRGGR